MTWPRVWRTQTSSTHSRGDRSTNTSQAPEDILSTADLGSIPRGRAILLASGVHPTLVRTTPWWETPDAAAVKASIALHDPTAATTDRVHERSIDTTKSRGN